MCFEMSGLGEHVRIFGLTAKKSASSGPEWEGNASGSSGLMDWMIPVQDAWLVHPPKLALRLRSEGPASSSRPSARSLCKLGQSHSEEHLSVPRKECSAERAPGNFRIKQIDSSLVILPRCHATHVTHNGGLFSALKNVRAQTQKHRRSRAFQQFHHAQRPAQSATESSLDHNIWRDSKPCCRTRIRPES